MTYLILPTPFIQTAIVKDEQGLFSLPKEIFFLIFDILREAGCFVGLVSFSLSCKTIFFMQDAFFKEKEHERSLLFQKLAFNGSKTITVDGEFGHVGFRFIGEGTSRQNPEKRLLYFNDLATSFFIVDIEAGSLCSYLAHLEIFPTEKGIFTLGGDNDKLIGPSDHLDVPYAALSNDQAVLGSFVHEGKFYFTIVTRTSTFGLKNSQMALECFEVDVKQFPAKATPSTTLGTFMERISSLINLSEALDKVGQSQISLFNLPEKFFCRNGYFFFKKMQKSDPVLVAFPLGPIITAIAPAADLGELIGADHTWRVFRDPALNGKYLTLVKKGSNQAYRLPLKEDFYVVNPYRIYFQFGFLFCLSGNLLYVLHPESMTKFERLFGPKEDILHAWIEEKSDKFTLRALVRTINQIEIITYLSLADNNVPATEKLEVASQYIATQLPGHYSKKFFGRQLV